MNIYCGECGSDVGLQTNEEYKKLKAENAKLKECILEIISETEYSANQWQQAWLPDEETKAQRVINEAKLLIKQLEGEK